MHARLRPSVKRSLVFLLVGAALAAGFASRALAAWGSAPLTVASSAGAQTGPILVNAPYGAYVAWTDRRDIVGRVAERRGLDRFAFDRGGRAVRPAGFLGRGTRGHDGRQRRHVARWSDLRTNPRSVWVNRLLSAGTLAFAKGGMRVATGAGAQLTPSVASDGAGGVFVAWQDSRNGNPDIFAQHVLSDGIARGARRRRRVQRRQHAGVAADRLRPPGGAVVLEDRRNNSLTSTQVFLQRLAPAAPRASRRTGSPWTATARPRADASRASRTRRRS